MPLSNKQLGNTFIQGQNIIIYPSGNSYVISKPDTESYGATGVGVAGVDNWPPSPIYVVPIGFQDLTGPNATMIYKSFSAGTGIGIIDTNNTLIFTASTPTVNGLTSFTSAGTGNILLLATAITSNTLFYKSITGTSNLSVNDDNNGTLTFSLAGSGAGTIISGVNVGTNANSLSFFSGLTTTINPNDTLVFRNLLAGPNITIAPSVTNNGDILISRGSPILVNQLSNIGDGARVLSAITASNLLVARTIANASGFSSALGAGIISPTSSTSSDATAFITAASITDSRQITAIQNLVSDLKTNNIWDKMLAIYPIVGGNANSHKYNLKDPRDLDAAYRLDFGSVNVIHDSNGIRSDAADSASQPTINTFIQFNLISALTDNIHLSFYSRTDVNNTSNPARGANIGNAVSNSFRSYPRYGGSWLCNIGDSGTVFPTVSDSLGFYIASRTSSTGNTFYKNGFLSAITSNTVHLSSITGTILLMRHITNPENTRQMAFYSFGSGLTNSEALAYTTAVENYQATLGRQVITLQNTVVNISPLTSTTANRLYISNATSQLASDANFTVDATSGSLGIGGAAVTTSRLLIAAGTGAISQIRLTPFTATTSLIDGDIWYSTSGNSLNFYKNNISTNFIFKSNNNVFTSVTNNKVIQVNTGGTLNSSIDYLKVYGFNTISSLTLTNTTSETSIISSLLSTGATKTLYNSNSVISDLISGKKFRFNAKGTLTTSNSINLTLKIKIGNTIISSSPLIGLTNTLSSAYFEIDTTFTIRSTGATGNVFGSGTIISDQGLTLSIPSNIQPIYQNTTTIDTTSDQTFDCTVTFSGTGTILTIYESTLEVLT
jgi:hypothetical protein